MMYQMTTWIICITIISTTSYLISSQVLGRSREIEFLRRWLADQAEELSKVSKQAEKIDALESYVHRIKTKLNIDAMEIK